MKIPGEFSVPVTLGLGAAEMFAAAMLAVPRFRRWGAVLAGLLLVAFMVFIGANYETLRGEECSCFPWLKRTVGPQFFATNALMLAMALVAGSWAFPSYGIRSAAMILGAVVVFGGVSYGVAVARLSGVEAPETVVVDGQPYSLKQGKIYLFFFDPECRHCFDAAKQMSGFQWRDVKVLTVATRVPQFAGQFLMDTGLKAPVTSDSEKLRARFTFTDPPYGVLLEHGLQREVFAQFDEAEPRARLQGLGVID